jgi:hypothetical protein
VSLKELKQEFVLFARYSVDNIPPCLQNVVDSPEHLFEVFESLNDSDLWVSKDNRLILSLEVFKKKR